MPWMVAGQRSGIGVLGAGQQGAEGAGRFAGVEGETNELG